MSGRRLLWAGPLTVFVVSLLLFGWLFHLFPVLYDTDSYFHLAIGRTYAKQGPIDQLPWARLSLMFDGFGDKEFLFHALLAPFAGTGSPEEAARGGRWALAFLNALLASVLALGGVLALGRWGLVVPWLVYAGSADFLGRVIRLRPELLSLLLLLAAIACVGRGRDRLLVLVAALYTLSYTAFHALLGLSFAWFVERGWRERRWSPALLVYPVIGIALGLVVHPNFPHNLLIWKVQSIDFFARKAELNVGLEIGPATADELLWLNLAWGLGLLVLWRSARRGPPAAEASTAWALHVATAVFGLLYLLMQRFSIYFIPLATLSLVFELRRRGLRLGNAVALPARAEPGRVRPGRVRPGRVRPGRVRLPLLLALVLVSALGLYRTAPLVHGLARAADAAAVERETDWAAFGRTVPSGAQVAAEWGSTHIYMFWAPQATYLNVLDPVFMALPFPRAYAAARAVFEGREPDVPLALEKRLGSRFLALSRFHPHGEALRRLRDDPRLALRYRGYTLLYEAVPEANADFVLDWRVVPPESPPLPPGSDISALTPYPRAAREEERALEGFVDVGRLDAPGGVAPGDCVSLIHEVDVAVAQDRTYELAAYGPSSLWLSGPRRPGGALVVATEATSRAVLGAGLTFPARFEAGQHRFLVVTCRGGGEPGPAGFYLRRLRR